VSKNQSISPCSIMQLPSLLRANLAKGAILAHGAVSESTDLARVDVGGTQPSLDARPVNKTDRTSALAGRQQRLARTCLVADTTDRTAHDATHININTRAACTAAWQRQRGVMGRRGSTLGEGAIDPKPRPFSPNISAYGCKTECSVALQIRQNEFPAGAHDAGWGGFTPPSHTHPTDLAHRCLNFPPSAFAI